jgi:hypothetical protein
MGTQICELSHCFSLPLQIHRFARCQHQSKQPTQYALRGCRAANAVRVHNRQNGRCAAADDGCPIRKMFRAAGEHTRSRDYVTVFGNDADAAYRLVAFELHVRKGALRHCDPRAQVLAHRGHVHTRRNCGVGSYSPTPRRWPAAGKAWGGSRVLRGTPRRIDHHACSDHLMVLKSTCCLQAAHIRSQAAVLRLRR